MQVIVSGRHLEITDAIRAHAEEKAGKLTRHYDRVAQVEVIASHRENHHHEVELIAHVERHEHFVAKAKHEDLYAAIDDAVEKMERQLTDHKERLRNRKHPAA